MARGFVRLPRSIFETKWWNKRRVFSESDAIIDLYQRADRMSQIIISVRSLADQWIWEQTKVLRFISTLEKEGFIITEKSSKGTVITIVEYGEGVAHTTLTATLSATQSATREKRKSNTKTPINREASNGQCNTKGNKSATQDATLTATHPATLARTYKDNNYNLNNNIKNIKQENKKTPPLTPPEGVHGNEDNQTFLSKVYPLIDFSFVDGELKHPFIIWLRYKHDELKFTYKTQSSLEICYRDLKAKSGGDNNIAMAIVEQSVANGWKGLFKIKQNYNGRQYQQQDDDERLARDAAQLIADIERKKMDGSYSDNLNPSF